MVGRISASVNGNNRQPTAKHRAEHALHLGRLGRCIAARPINWNLRRSFVVMADPELEVNSEGAFPLDALSGRARSRASTTRAAPVRRLPSS
jgi:hypothetical protein